MELGEELTPAEELDSMCALMSAMLAQANEAGAPVTPGMLASQSQYPHIVASMREMVAKQSGAQKPQFQVPLRLLFTKSLSSLGIATPVFTAFEINGSFRVRVSLVVCDRNATIDGDLSNTSELAETSAIKKAIVHLRRDEKIGIVDISDRKARDLTNAWGPSIGQVFSASRLMVSILRKWRDCIVTLTLVQKYAQKCLSRGFLDPRPANSVLHTMVLMKGAAAIHINNFDHQLRALSQERDKYLAAWRAQHVTRPEYEAVFGHVDALCLLLQYLGLNECQYTAYTNGNGLYIGVAQLFLQSEQIRIEAKQPKITVAEAHNEAALGVIYHLEEVFEVQVVGADHNAYLEAEQMAFICKGLSLEFRGLAASMMHFWDDTIVKINNFMNQLIEDGNETNLKQSLVHRLQVAYAECRRSYRPAADRFAELN